MVGDPGRARAWSLCGLLTLTFGLVSPSLARAQAAPPGATPAAASKPATPEPAEDPDAPGSAELRERVFGDDIAVLQRRYFRKRGRVAVAGGGVASVNDVLVSHLGAGGALRYFVGERHGLAARVMAYRNFDSPVRQSVQQDLQLFPERTNLGYEAQLAYTYSPIDGKFTAFGAAIAYFDTYLQVGAGVVDTFAGGMLPSGMLGVGTRFYMTRWLALEAEVNDTIFMEKYPSGTTLIQHLSVGMNLALFMPFGWDEDR